MDEQTLTAFAGERLLARALLPDLLRVVKAHVDTGGEVPLIFEDSTGRQVDFDLRGDLEEVLTRVQPPEPRRGPGRPKLGVTAREVTLLPRHWAWLDEQSGGASATLRRLVDEARKRDDAPGRARRAAEATTRFLTATSGNQPHFEEVLRALYAGHGERFTALMEGWPPDIRAHAGHLAAPALAPSSPHS